MTKKFLLITILLFNSFFTNAQTDDIETLLQTAGIGQNKINEYINKNIGKANGSIATQNLNDTSKKFLYNQVPTANNTSTILPATPPVEEIKHESKVFGKNILYENKITVFDKSTLAKAPDTYTLGEGDELNITIWGYTEFNDVMKVDEDGFINAANVGRIYIKGLTFKEAKEIITKRFAANYDLSNSKIAIRLNYARVIRVNIVGEVNNPGTYSAQALNSAFNLLSLANGPNDIGSVRNIFIKRNGVTVKTLDVYEFLLNPESKAEFFLQDNDYLVVPAYSKIVSIDGQIKRPMSYELKNNESIIDLMKYCGGTTSNAYKSSVTILRNIQNKQELINLNLEEILAKGQTVALSDGDKITVATIAAEFNNYVEIKGAVNIPNKYQINDKIKLDELVKRAGGLSQNAMHSQIYITRTLLNNKKVFITCNIDSAILYPNSASNIILQAMDEVEIFYKKDFEDSTYIAIQGFVRKEGSFLFKENMRLSDAIFQAGGFPIGAQRTKIEVSRIIERNSNGDYISVPTIVKTIDLNNEYGLESIAHDFELMPYDEIFVRKATTFEHQSKVKIEGEINYPGYYSLSNKNEKLTDLITRAGGFKQSAFKSGILLIRKESNLGFVVVDYEKAIRKPNSPFNYILKEGDKITIPKINELVSISGAVEYDGKDSFSIISAPHEPFKRAKYYINNYAGGFTQKSLRRKTYVIDANGHFRKTIHPFFFVNIYPKVEMGSKIIVPYKKSKVDNNNKVPIDWNQVIERSTIKLTGLLTLTVLALTAVTKFKQ